MKKKGMNMSVPSGQVIPSNKSTTFLTFAKRSASSRAFFAAARRAATSSSWAERFNEAFREDTLQAGARKALVHSKKVRRKIKMCIIGIDGGDEQENRMHTEMRKGRKRESCLMTKQIRESQLFLLMWR